MNETQKDNTQSTEADESLALAKISLELLKGRNGYFKKLWIALIISILVNVVLVFSFLWYESQWDYTTTTTSTITTTQEVEGENSSINNVQGNQYNDQAIHNEGGE